MMFYCRICQEWCAGDADHHHIRKWAVFHDDSLENIAEVCRTPCHDALEELIRIKENEILRQHPEIYTDALKEIAGNHKLIKRMYRLIEERRAGRVKKKGKGWRYR